LLLWLQMNSLVQTKRTKIVATRHILWALNAGMGTRRKSSRPRRDRDAHLPRQDRDVGFTSRDKTETRPKPRQDVKISRRDRDEMFVALET